MGGNQVGIYRLRHIVLLEDCRGRAGTTNQQILISFLRPEINYLFSEIIILYLTQQRGFVFKVKTGLPCNISIALRKCNHIVFSLIVRCVYSLTHSFLFFYILNCFVFF